MKHRWLIDYDSTLAATDNARFAAVNAKFGTEYDQKFVTAWLNKDINYVDDEHEAWMWSDECFMSEMFQASVPPVEGAISGMLALMQAGHHVMIVSDRPAKLFEVTRDWLDRQGLDMVRLLFTRHKHSMSTGAQGMTKLQAAWSYKLTHVVEDAPHHSMNLAAKSYIDKIYLLDKPYNQDADHPKIVRVPHWNMVVEHQLQGVLV